MLITIPQLRETKEYVTRVGKVTSKTPRIKHETRSVGTAYRAGQSLGKFGYRAGR